MEQLQLFEEKVASNEIWDAHTVIKNLYNKNLADFEVFKKYFEYTCMVSSWDIELSTRNYFLEEASTALVVFAENANLDAEQLATIKECHAVLEKKRGAISLVHRSFADNQIRETTTTNNSILKELAELKGKLIRADTQEIFDQLLLILGEKDNSLVKEALSHDQKILYDRMTKEFSTLISEQLTKLAMISNVDYNRSAVKDFKNVMDEFMKSEGKYTNNHSHLYSLVSSRLFSYDPGRLFNETLIYYNHIYSYIFSKLDEDGKYRLTQISIDTEKLKF